MMKKQLIIWLLFCINGTTQVFAQWTEEDSIWLENVLSGNEQIRLNPETLKAIEKGKFLNTDEPDNQLLAVPPILPILKEFNGVGIADTGLYEIDSGSIPPSLFAKYRKELDSLRVNKYAFTFHKPLVEKEEFQIANLPVTVSAGARNIFSDEVKDGQRHGAGVVTLKSRFSLDDILLFLFSKKERDKRRNRKKARAWQGY